MSADQLRVYFASAILRLHQPPPVDAAVLKDNMVLAYEWPAGRTSVRWSLVSSTLLKALDGEYRLTPKGSGTEVTYESLCAVCYLEASGGVLGAH